MGTGVRAGTDADREVDTPVALMLRSIRCRVLLAVSMCDSLRGCLSGMGLETHSLQPSSAILLVMAQLAGASASNVDTSTPWLLLVLLGAVACEMRSCLLCSRQSSRCWWWSCTRQASPLISCWANPEANSFTCRSRKRCMLGTSVVSYILPA